MENQNVDRELGWDDSVEKDGGEFILLPEGEYEVTVVSFERGRYNGGEKLPACNIAKLKLKVETDAGEALINHNIFLHSRCEGLISTFFNSIGQKKQGERITMDWNKVVGAKGLAKIGTRVYNEKTYNEVKKFIPSDKATTQSATQSYKEGIF